MINSKKGDATTHEHNDTLRFTTQFPGAATGCPSRLQCAACGCDKRIRNLCAAHTGHQWITDGRHSQQLISFKDPRFFITLPQIAISFYSPAITNMCIVNMRTAIWSALCVCMCARISILAKNYKMNCLT